MTRRDRFITQALVAAIFIVALLVVGHAAHAQPMPITCHEVARHAAAQQETYAQFFCGLLTIIVLIL